MASSYTQPPNTEEHWKCCKCEFDVVPTKLDGTTCPNCSHTKCDDCGHVTPPPTPVRNSHTTYYRYFECSHDSDLRFHLADLSQPAPYANGNADLESHYGYGIAHNHSARPSITGWWKCCQCFMVVNPAVNGSDCPDSDCGHKRCYYCTTCA
jgi:hypothetical protein